MVEFPGLPAGGKPEILSMVGLMGTFSRAAVVREEEVAVLMPFTTRRGPKAPASTVVVVVEGLRALTTSLTALARLF